MVVDIIQGHAMEVMPLMPDQSVDLVIADPPYNVTSLKWDKWVPGWPDEVRRLLKPSGSIWVFGTMRMFMRYLEEFKGWKLSQDIVWEKHNGTGLFNDRFRRVHETVCHFYAGPWGNVYRDPQYTMDAKKRTIRKPERPAQWMGRTGPTFYQTEDGGPRLMRSVIFARSEHRRALHPTQKPVDIVEPILLYSCPPGGLVLDPFAGSGTTGVVARENGRNAVLIEIDPEYIAKIRRRLEIETPVTVSPTMTVELPCQ